jgi:ABC-type phosphate transport system substrate-binding protein
MNKLSTVFAVIASTVAFNASAVSVIVHPSNAAALDANAIQKIFLGKLKAFPSGGEAIPIDLESGAARDEFLAKVINKNDSQLKAYWSKLIFTGKGQAPKAVASEQEVINLVKANPNIIGYVSDGAVSADVKVIAKF